MQTPIYSAEEARSRETFLALMWAFSYPGRVQTLPVDPAQAYLSIAETLLDLETSYFTSDTLLAEQFTHTGARALEPERAAYHFYAELTEQNLVTLKLASNGTMLYPDQSATLVIGCKFGSGQPFILTGPGIQTEIELQVGGIDTHLWALRECASRYPLGWDIFLVDGNRVIGLPRTTQMQLMMSEGEQV